MIVSLGLDDASAVITIQDRGPGIPGDVRPLLFQLFGGGPSSEGLGVGLYLVRGIAEAHGGSVDVETDSNGTRFVIRLPLDIQSSTRAVSPVASSPAEAFAVPV